MLHVLPIHSSFIWTKMCFPLFIGHNLMKFFLLNIIERRAALLLEKKSIENLQLLIVIIFISLAGNPDHDTEHLHSHCSRRTTATTTDLHHLLLSAAIVLRPDHPQQHLPDPLPRALPQLHHHMHRCPRPLATTRHCTA
jgi:hypothetical protein